MRDTEAYPPGDYSPEPPTREEFEATLPAAPGAETREGPGRLVADCATPGHPDGEHRCVTITADWPAPAPVEPGEGDATPSRSVVRRMAAMRGEDPETIEREMAEAHPQVGAEWLRARVWGLQKQNADLHARWLAAERERDAALATVRTLETLRTGLARGASPVEDACPACTRGEGDDGWHYPDCAAARAEAAGLRSRIEALCNNAHAVPVMTIEGIEQAPVIWPHELRAALDGTP